MGKNILLVVFIFNGFIQLAISQCNNPDDYTALRALYLSTDGDNWTNNSGWPDAATFNANPSPPGGTDMSGWWGIQCNSTDRVFCIDMDGNPDCGNSGVSGNNMHGTLPSEIGLLTELQQLTFWGPSNGIGGAIPDELGNLQNVWKLNLAFNEFVELPSTIQNMTSLLFLTLSNNNLSGPLPDFIGNMNNLRHIWLNGNNFTGAIPSSYFTLTNLTFITLAGNECSGIIPDDFGNLTNLTSFIFSNNNFSGELPSTLSNLVNCTAVNFDGNNFTGTLDALIGMPQVTTLNLDNNSFIGCIPVEFINFCGESIDLNNNPLLPWQGDFDQFCLTDGSQEAQIGAPCDDGDDSNGTDDTIQEDCSCGPCIHPDYDALVALYNSTNGDNWTNNGTNADPQSTTEGWNKDCDVCEWYGITCDIDDRVTCIDLDGQPLCFIPGITGNNLIGVIPPEIGNLTYLTSLILAKNSIIGAIPISISNLTNLQHLDLQDNQITSIPNTFSSLTSLQEINLSINLLTGDIPQEFGNLVNLVSLNLNSNQLSGTTNYDFNQNPNLEILNLGNNNLTGSIPTSISSLINLTNLILSVNQFDGSIPTSFSNLLSLEQLSISNNSLVGEIPSFIGALSNLTTFTANSNNLSGCIPQNLLNNCANNFNLNVNSLLPWQGDFDQFCLTDGSQSAQVGAPCDDGDDSNGTDDTIQEDCSCGPCIHPDYDALIALYNSTNGDNWTNNGTNSDPQSTTEGWGKDCDVCNWYGIQCDINGRVTCIALRADGSCSTTNDIGNNLVGFLPDDIGELTMLERLNLGENSISGVLPNSFYELTKLEIVNFRNNNFDGNISNNIIQLNNLGGLNLYGNNFSGEIPQELFELPNLNVFNCYQCNLSGELPISLYSSSIARLNLGFNNLIGELDPSISTITSLYDLSLIGNSLEGAIPIGFDDLPNLTFLNLRFNDFSGCIPSGLLNICNIPQLLLDNNPKLAWQGDVDEFCLTDGSQSAQIGAPCDDGDDSNGTNDEILPDCTCGQPCPTITPTLSGPTEICEGDNATYTFNFSDGLGPYTIIWNGGEILTNINDGHTETITNVSTNLSLMVTQGNDSNGCLLSNSNTINLTVNTLPTGNITGTFEICEGESTTITASGGNTYVWSTSESTPSITVSPTVTTTYMVTVTDVNLCTDITSQEIIVNSNPTAQITGNLEICESETTMLSASGGNSYLWSTGENTPTIETNTTDADYSVTVTDGNSCSDESSVTLTVNDLPLLVLNGDNEICNGETANITASGDGTMYNWDSGQNTAMISVSPSLTTTYTVTATDNNSCTQVAFWTVIVNNLPIAQITGEDEVCDGESITLTASGGIIYNWSDGQAGPSIDINPTSNTTYTVTVSDANNCSSIASQSVTVLPLPVIINPSPISLCDDGSGSATTNLFDFDNTITDGQPGTTVTWSESNIEPLIPLTGGDNYTVSNSTILYAQVDNGTCDSEIITITFLVENDIVVTNPSPILLCSDGGLGLDIDPQDYSALLTNGNPSFSVNWSANNTMLPLITGTIFINNGASLFAQVTDGECSSIVTEISFQVNNIPLVTMPSDISTCAFDSNGDGLFDLTIFENEINGGMGNSVVWSEDEQGQNIINNTNAYIGFNGDIIYASVDDGICQSIFIEIPLIVNPLPAIQENLIIETCQAFSNESVQIDLSVYEATLSNGNTITWSASQNDNLIITSPSNFQTSASITIYAKATSNGCESEYTPVEIILTDAPSPTINTIGGITNICPNTSFELSINGTFDQIEWSTGEQGSFIEITEGGTYSVTVTDGDCTGENQIFITESDLNLDCAVLDDDVTIMVTSTSLPYDVSWSSGTISGGETGLTSTNYTINDLPSGEYTIGVTDDLGCLMTCNVDVEADEACIHPDVPTLIALYNATTSNGDWDITSGWALTIQATNCDPCGIEQGNEPWHGIVCANDNNRVTSLLLPNNNLDGELPDISDLDSLEFINFNDNNLTGNWNFKNQNLFGINISDNPNLKTTIPNFNLPRLEQLIAFGDSLIGPLPLLDSVPLLRELFIYNNEFNDEVPDWQLDSLIGISLFNSKLFGPLPSLVASQKLEEIFFNFNEMTGEIPPYHELPNLQQLNLDNNDFSGCMDVDLYCAEDIDFDFSFNPKLANGGVDNASCDTSFMEVGFTCDDGDATTVNDTIGVDCVCVGETDGMRPFVTTWVTNKTGISCDSCIRVPTFPGETYNYEVDVDFVMGEPFVADFTGVTGDFVWNAGRKDTVTIAIRGEFPRIYFNEFANDSLSKDNFKLLDIAQWGDIEWQSMASAFSGCVYMNASATDTADVSAVTSMSSCFRDCRKFNGKIGGWDVSNVFDLSQMFWNAREFNSDIGGWDVSNVIDMSFMFQEAQNFNQDITLWNTSKVTDMSNMFLRAISFNQDISTKVINEGGTDEYVAWDVSNVVDMQAMFQLTYAFDADISNWNVTNVTNLRSMFLNAQSFNGKINEWNVSRVIDMTTTFTGATAFDQSLSDWDLSSAEKFNSSINQVTIGIFDNSGLSCENYSATLEGWAANPNTPDGLEMQALGMEYNEDGEMARNILIGNGWEISGDEYVEGCIEPDTCINFIDIIESAYVLVTNTSCGENNGTATVQLPNSTSNYSYLWNTGETTQTITELSMGTYYVTVSEGDCEVVISGIVSFEEEPVIEWERCIGGSSQEVFSQIIVDNEDHIFVLGHSYSNDFDVPSTSDDADGFIVKLSSDGMVLNKNVIEHSNGSTDRVYSMVMLEDGSIVACGHRNFDNAWYFKLNSNFELIESFIRQFESIYEQVIKTKDGNLLMVGSTDNVGGNINGDILITKMTYNLEIIWERTIGGSGRDGALTVVETADGGFLLTGNSRSNDGIFEGLNKGGNDLVIIKCDSLGQVEWNKNYGGSNDEVHAKSLLLRDSSIIVLTRSRSIDGDVLDQEDRNKYWIVKTDLEGNIIQSEVLAYVNQIGIGGMIQTDDGEIVLNITKGNGGIYQDAESGPGGFWLLKLDENFNKIYSANFGGTSSDYSYGDGIAINSKGNIILGGTTSSIDLDVQSINRGAQDHWIVTLTQPTLPDILLENDTTICQESAIELIAFDSLCNSCTYLWSDGNTDSIRIVDPMISTLYSVTLTDVNGCASVDSIFITVRPSIFTNIDTTILEGDSVLFAGQYYFDEGIYFDTVSLNNRCDSVTSLTLIFSPCPQLSCRSQENIYFDVGFMDTLTLQMVLFSYSPDCNFSFDPDQVVEGLSFDCADICASPQITVYDIANDTTCTVTIHVRDQNETCGTYSPIIPTIKIEDIVYDGSGFVDVNVSLDNFRDVFQYNFYLPFDTNRLEYVSATYENPDANLRLRLSNNVPVDFVRFTNQNFLQVLNLPDNTLLATLRFRILDPLLCEDISLGIDDNVGFGTDILNCYVDLVDPIIEEGTIRIVPDQLQYAFSSGVICLEDNLDVTITNLSVYESIYLNGQLVTNSLVNLNPQGDSTFVIAYVAPSGCSDSISEAIIVNNPPSITINEPIVTVCSDADDGETTIDLNSLVSTSSSGTWTDVDGQSLPTATVDLDGSPVGDVQFLFTTTEAIAPCTDTTVMVTVTVVDCDGCAPGGCLFDNPPTFTIPSDLVDVVVACSDDVPVEQQLSYTNDLTGDCLISGTVEAMRDASAYDGCQGTITDTWSYTTVCDETITYSRTITIDIDGELVYIDTPATTGEATCDDIDLYSIPLEYTNDGAGNCEVMGTVEPSVQENYDYCGGTAVLSWAVSDDCYGDIAYTQVLTIAANDEFSIGDTPPSNITVSCDELPYTPQEVVLQNDQSLGCAYAEVLEVEVVEAVANCQGTILHRWSTVHPCTGEDIILEQLVTVLDCDIPLLEDDYIEVRASAIESINLLDNDVLYEENEVEVLAFDDDNFVSYAYDPDGTFTFVLEDSFFDTIKIDYIACDTTALCMICDTATLKIVDESLKDIILTDIITPNNDGQNDVLRFNFEDEITGAQLYIYNRWGDKIYEKLNYTNDWDASGYPGGIYFYVLRIGDAIVKKTLTVVK